MPTQTSLNTILHGDCLETLKQLEDNSIDAIVTDPPYGLSFMSKKWDYDVPSVEIWQECLRVLKPGGYLLAFAGTRTQHRMAVRIEDAGFEIRDMIAWVYGSGFPKSLNIGKAVDKLNGKPRPTDEFKQFLRDGKKKACLTSEQIDKEIGNGSGIFSQHYVGNNDQIEYPTKEKYQILKSILQLDDSFDYLINWAEAEREIIGTKKTNTTHCFGNLEGKIGEEIDYHITLPSTKEAKKLEGWGTALKPAWESLTVAQKQLYSSASDMIELVYIIKQTLCLSQSFVSAAEKVLRSSQREQTQLDIAQWIAEKNTNIQEDLSVLMDMLRLESEKDLNWNIVLLWLNILAELSKAMNTSTTSTELSQIIELKTLLSMEWENIFQSITQAKDNQTNGLSANVWNAESVFNALRLKLKTIQELFAQESVILKEKEITFAPELSPIIMSRKPLDEKTVAENCLKWGVGGINIDATRIPSYTDAYSNDDIFPSHKLSELRDKLYTLLFSCSVDKKDFQIPANVYEYALKWKELKDYLDGCLICFRLYDELTPLFQESDQVFFQQLHDAHDGIYRFQQEQKDSLLNQDTDHLSSLDDSLQLISTYIKVSDYTNNDTTPDIKSQGRFPANLILDGSDEVVELFPNESQRFFYCAKASKSERNKGCEELEDKMVAFGNETGDGLGRGISNTRQDIPTKNNHPTVKPIALMEYLIKLVSRENAVVLDPFAGSGSTLVACKKLNRNYIGCELSEDYIKIANARLNALQRNNSLEEDSSAQ